jgi:outer membrane protein OmpA-like peptidoglycan-associated protein
MADNDDRAARALPLRRRRRNYGTMRRIALILVMSANFAIAAPAWAQTEPVPTVEDYVCTFSGDCGDANAAEAEEPAPGPRPRLSVTRGFALSRPDAPAPARRRNPAPRQRIARNLAAPAGSPGVPPAGPGQRVNLRLNFETGSATLTASARAQAEVFARSLLMPQLRNMRFLIEGHTDSVGLRDRNVELSQRRAQSLADFLIAAGVPRDRLVVRGYGPDRPLPNFPASAGENRRVEAVRIS